MSAFKLLIVKLYSSSAANVISSAGVIPSIKAVIGSPLDSLITLILPVSGSRTPSSSVTRMVPFTSPASTSNELREIVACSVVWFCGIEPFAPSPPNLPLLPALPFLPLDPSEPSSPSSPASPSSPSIPFSPISPDTPAAPFSPLAPA